MSERSDLTEREEWLVKAAYLAGFSAAYNRAGSMVGDWVQLNRRQLARDAPAAKENEPETTLSVALSVAPDDNPSSGS